MSVTVGGKTYASASAYTRSRIGGVNKRTGPKKSKPSPSKRSSGGTSGGSSSSTSQTSSTPSKGKTITTSGYTFEVSERGYVRRPSATMSLKQYKAYQSALKKNRPTVERKPSSGRAQATRSKIVVDPTGKQVSATVYRGYKDKTTGEVRETEVDKTYFSRTGKSYTKTTRGIPRFVYQEAGSSLEVEKPKAEALRLTSPTYREALKKQKQEQITKKDISPESYFSGTSLDKTSTTTTTQDVAPPSTTTTSYLDLGKKQPQSSYDPTTFVGTLPGPQKKETFGSKIVGGIKSYFKIGEETGKQGYKVKDIFGGELITTNVSRAQRYAEKTGVDVKSLEVGKLQETGVTMFMPTGAVAALARTAAIAVGIEKGTEVAFDITAPKPIKEIKKEVDIGLITKESYEAERQAMKEASFLGKIGYEISPKLSPKKDVFFEHAERRIEGLGLEGKEKMVALEAVRRERTSKSLGEALAILSINIGTEQFGRKAIAKKFATSKTPVAGKGIKTFWETTKRVAPTLAKAGAIEGTSIVLTQDIAREEGLRLKKEEIPDIYTKFEPTTETIRVEDPYTGEMVERDITFTPSRKKDQEIIETFGFAKETPEGIERIEKEVKINIPKYEGTITKTGTPQKLVTGATFGAVSAATVGSLIAGLGAYGTKTITPKKNIFGSVKFSSLKPAAKVGRIVEVGAYVSDPFEKIGDIGADKVAKIGTRLFKVPTITPTIVKTGDKTIQFGTTTTTAAKEIGSFVKVGDVVMSKVDTKTKTPASTIVGVKTPAQVQTPVPIASQVSIPASVTASVNVQTPVEVPTSTPIDVETEITTPVDTKTGITIGSQTQTQTQSFVNINTFVPDMKLPPVLPFIPKPARTGAFGKFAKRPVGYKPKYTASLEAVIRGVTAESAVGVGAFGLRPIITKKKVKVKKKSSSKKKKAKNPFY